MKKFNKGMAIVATSVLLAGTMYTVAPNVMNTQINAQSIQFKNATAVNYFESEDFKRDFVEVLKNYGGETALSDYNAESTETKIEVVMKDKTFRKNDDNFVEADLAKVEKLRINGKELSSLVGIDKFTNLKHLDLSNNQITDVTELAKLTKLKQLALGRNQITDVKPLYALTNLERLFLNKNQISTIEGMGALASLKLLDLKHNTVSDLAPLAGLIELKRLYLATNNIEDASALATLVNMESLDLDNNNITDLSFVQNMIKMKKLRLNSNSIEEIESLAALNQLELLWLRANKITDFSVLTNKAIKEMNLTSQRIRPEVDENQFILELKDEKGNVVSMGEEDNPNDPHATRIMDLGDTVYAIIRVYNADENVVRTKVSENNASWNVVLKPTKQTMHNVTVNFLLDGKKINELLFMAEEYDVLDLSDPIYFGEDPKLYVLADENPNLPKTIMEETEVDVYITDKMKTTVKYVENGEVKTEEVETVIGEKLNIPETFTIGDMTYTVENYENRPEVTHERDQEFELKVVGKKVEKIEENKKVEENKEVKEDKKETIAEKLAKKLPYAGKEVVAGSALTLGAAVLGSVAYVIISAKKLKGVNKGKHEKK